MRLIADPNKNPGGRAILDGNGKNQYEALARMARDNQKAKEQFIELGVLTDKNRNVFTFLFFVGVFEVKFRGPVRSVSPSVSTLEYRDLQS